MLPRFSVGCRSRSAPAQQRFQCFLARERKGRACLGVFEGYSLLDGPPGFPHEMPRITLFFETLAQAANYRERVCVFGRFELPTCTNRDITWGGTKNRLRMPAWDKGHETHTKSRPESIPKDCYTLESVQKPNACSMAARNEPGPSCHWRKRAVGPQGVQPQIPLL
jgi:hypothetical protein